MSLIHQFRCRLVCQLQAMGRWMMPIQLLANSPLILQGPLELANDWDRKEHIRNSWIFTWHFLYYCLCEISLIYRRYLGTAVEVFPGTHHGLVDFIGGHLKLLVKGKATLAKSSFFRRHSNTVTPIFLLVRPAESCLLRSYIHQLSARGV